MATLHSTEFLMEFVTCRHHVYKYIMLWSRVVGEELECQIETGNVHDLYAVGQELMLVISQGIYLPSAIYFYERVVLLVV